MKVFSFLTRAVVLFVVALGLQLPRTDAAEFIFTGTISEVEPGWLSSGIAVGDTFTGVLAYNPLMPGSGGPNPVGIYPGYDHSSDTSYMSLAVAIGHHGFAISPPLSSLIEVIKNAGGDSFTASGELVELIRLTLSDPTGTALSSSALPSSLNFGNWQSGTIWIGAPHAGAGSIAGNLTALYPIPEPGTGALFTVGLIALLVRNLNRRRAS
jgi:hypothetical protein